MRTNNYFGEDIKAVSFFVGVKQDRSVYERCIGKIKAPKLPVRMQ
jgi:hypothetical protein